MRGVGWMAAAWLTAGCALDPPVTAAFAPAPGDRLCDDRRCVTVPLASAMPAGRPAAAPRGWLDYCARHDDPACGRAAR